MIHRKTTIAIVGGLAGTALLGSLKFALPASADASGHARVPEHCKNHGHLNRHRPCPVPSSSRTPTARPSTTAVPSLSPSALPSATPPVSPSAPVSPTTVPVSPSPSVTPSVACTTTAGNAASLASPGVGAVTVTITVCGGNITAATSTLSQSNYGANSSALPAMDKLVLTYAKTDINMVNYSGATLTSEAYRTSLASALTKAGI